MISLETLGKLTDKKTSHGVKLFFFIVNLGFIRLRTASCVFALFKTAFIKIREYNLFKLKLLRTV